LKATKIVAFDGGKKMAYKHLQEDLLAISTLLRAGQIDAFEAQEMRSYLEAISA